MTLYGCVGEESNKNIDTVIEADTMKRKESTNKTNNYRPIIFSDKDFKHRWGKKDSNNFVLGKKKGSVQNKPDSIYNFVAINAEPPGGMLKFQHWINENYELPHKALENKVKGNVLISFVVEKDGSLTNFVLFADQGFATGQSVIEMLKTCDKWYPAIHDGRKVRALYYLQIRLDLDKMKVDTNNKVLQILQDF